MGTAAHRSMWSVLAVSAPLLVGCFHDFDAFDPVGADGGAVSTEDAGASSAFDSSTPHDAQLPPDDSAVPPESDGGSTCGADCRIEATSCAGVCAEVEQSCAAACDGGTCKSSCITKEASCRSNCVTSCETCTSGEGCIDQAGCTAAAP